VIRSAAVELAERLVDAGFDVSLAGYAERGKNHPLHSAFPERWSVTVSRSEPLEGEHFRKLFKIAEAMEMTVHFAPTDGGLWLQSKGRP
jgi:hypothetical protein